MGTYVIGDIHNENRKLQNMLKRIAFGENDHIYMLGDLFDRGGDEADPVGVYFTVLELGKQCTVIRGNHDQWLADYIHHYGSLSEREQSCCKSYRYNSFDLLQQRLTLVDLLQLESFIRSFPLQVELELEQKYLFAHAMTFYPDKWKEADYYLMGGWHADRFLAEGIEGYTSFCGHNDTSNLVRFSGRYCDEKISSIWCNEIGNVYMMDCGCGFASGRLACMCLESGERFYE